MNALTESVQILRDAEGQPAFVVIPFADYQAFVKGENKVKHGIPAAVVDLAMDNEWSAARAWREYKELTQTEVAKRMGITQGAYAQLEAKKSIRKSSRDKIAKAFDIHESQLDF
ncbi:MAG: helix-turn-helix domain-containing protein [Syntrophorhabdaceae bacterium]|nr:helix-turn-helix domain-containing protein [Syntrophorhabdaceae bacterium]